jgi:hypothetical protein
MDEYVPAVGDYQKAHSFFGLYHFTTPLVRSASAGAQV